MIRTADDLLQAFAACGITLSRVTHHSAAQLRFTFFDGRWVEAAFRLPAPYG